MDTQKAAATMADNIHVVATWIYQCVCCLEYLYRILHRQWRHMPYSLVLHSPSVWYEAAKFKTPIGTLGPASKYVFGEIPVHSDIYPYQSGSACRLPSRSPSAGMFDRFRPPSRIFMRRTWGTFTVAGLLVCLILFHISKPSELDIRIYKCTRICCHLAQQSSTVFI